MGRKRCEPGWNEFSGSKWKCSVPDSQATECEGVPAGELPERLRPADAQCLCDEQLRRGRRSIAENLPTTGEDQSERCPEPRGRPGRDADRASLGSSRGVAAKTSHHQSDRIVPVDGAAGGAQRKALARRKSAATLDGYRTPGSRKTLSPDQGLSRNAVAEGAFESVAHSAEGGPSRRSRLNMVAGRLTVLNIESRCNQLKLGHPPQIHRSKLTNCGVLNVLFQNWSRIKLIQV